MGNRFSGPVYRDEIDRIEFAEIVGTRLPARRKIGFRPIIEISYVVDRDPVALDRCIGQIHYFRLPFAIVRRGDPKKQPEHQREAEHRDQKSASAARRADHTNHRQSRIANSCHRTPRFRKERSVVERGDGPKGNRYEDDPGDDATRELDSFHDKDFPPLVHGLLLEDLRRESIRKRKGNLSAMGLN